MDAQLFDRIKSELYKVLKDKFQLGNDHLDTLVQKGQDVLKDVLVAHVTQNGSKELESIISRSTDYKSSPIYTKGVAALAKKINGQAALKGNSSQTVSELSVSTLIESLQNAFSQSGQSADTKGICNFLGLDPMLLKMVNSPVGKMFGKFFKK